MQSNKEFYRSELLRISPYIKLTTCYKEVGISLSAMSKFLNHNRDELVSVDKLEQLFSYIKQLELL
ncbi:MAG: hypothetical protein RR673_08790 [Erysipelotrichaceae bacterium]